jgi:hypothetical protein
MTGDTGSQRTRDIVVGAILATVLLAMGLGLGYLVTRESAPTVVVLPTRMVPATAVAIVPSLIPTPEGQATPVPVADTPLVAVPTQETVTPLPTLPPDEIVRFRVQVDSIIAHAGPSDEVGVVGALTVNQEVLVAGRSADGIWWLVCCVSTTPAWVKLENGNLILISGDIGKVDVIQ